MYMAMKVEINEAGIAIRTIIALRKLCRNNIITAATNNTASSKSCNTASTDSIVGSDVSVATVNLIPSFLYFSSISLNFCFVRSAISTAFASLCFLIRRPIPFNPLKRLTVTTSSDPSVTSATSPKRTEEVPSVKTIRFFRSSTVWNFPAKRTVICSDSLFSLPVGNSTFAAATIWFTCASDIPYIFSLSLSTSTLKALFSPPIT
ncbi:hypothetical protein D3C86_1369060 [compost metagenome]